METVDHAKADIAALVDDGRRSAMQALKVASYRYLPVDTKSRKKNTRRATNPLHKSFEIMERVRQDLDRQGDDDDMVHELISDVNVDLREAEDFFHFNPYAALTVSPESDDKVVRRAYLKLAKRFHPDKNAGTSRLFVNLKHAYDKLSDKETRAEVDRRLSQVPVDRCRQSVKDRSIGFSRQLQHRIRKRLSSSDAEAMAEDDGDVVEKEAFPTMAIRRKKKGQGQGHPQRRRMRKSRSSRQLNKEDRPARKVHRVRPRSQSNPARKVHRPRSQSNAHTYRYTQTHRPRSRSRSHAKREESNGRGRGRGRKREDDKDLEEVEASSASSKPSRSRRSSKAKKGQKHHHTRREKRRSSRHSRPHQEEEEGEEKVAIPKEANSENEKNADNDGPLSPTLSRLFFDPLRRASRIEQMKFTEKKGKSKASLSRSTPPQMLTKESRPVRRLSALVRFVAGKSERHEKLLATFLGGDSDPAARKERAKSGRLLYKDAFDKENVEAKAKTRKRSGSIVTDVPPTPLQIQKQKQKKERPQRTGSGSIITEVPPFPPQHEKTKKKKKKKKTKPRQPRTRTVDF